MYVCIYIYIYIHTNIVYNVYVYNIMCKGLVLGRAPRAQNFCVSAE